MSVRFLGRRVYLAMAVVIASVQRAGASAAASQLAQTLSVPVRTLERWRSWWRAQFPLTALWRGAGGRFMPPVASGDLPASALERFAGTPAQSMRHFLLFLTPLTVGQPITPFASFNCPDFYRLPRNTGTVMLEKSPWAVMREFPTARSRR